MIIYIIVYWIIAAFEFELCIRKLKDTLLSSTIHFYTCIQCIHECMRIDTFVRATIPKQTWLRTCNFLFSEIKAKKKWPFWFCSIHFATFMLAFLQKKLHTQTHNIYFTLSIFMHPKNGHLKRVPAKNVFVQVILLSFHYHYIISFSPMSYLFGSIRVTM